MEAYQFNVFGMNDILFQTLDCLLSFLGCERERDSVKPTEFKATFHEIIDRPYLRSSSSSRTSFSSKAAILFFKVAYIVAGSMAVSLRFFPLPFCVGW